jgi:FtsZ-binding cell division protein ZapB
MERGEEVDQFELLEEKMNALIAFIGGFQREKEGLLEKIHIQEEKIADLTGELEQLKSAKDHAKQRIVSLLEKIEQLDI